MKTKTVLILLFSALFLFQFTTPSHALFNSDIKKAKEFIQVDMYPEAVELLKKRINEEPTDADAHYLLGECYLHQGDYNRADESFGRAVKLGSEYGEKIWKSYKDVSDRQVQKGNLRAAGNLFNRAVQYNPSLASEGYEFFRGLGDRSRGTSAVGYYDNAMGYAKDKDQQDQIGYRYLKVAASVYPSSECERLKSKASGIVGQEWVEKVMPSERIENVFKGTYTDADISEPDKVGGWIIAFDWLKVRTGYATIIETDVPSGCKQVYYFRGKAFKPESLPIENGKETIPITQRPKDGKFLIWMQKGKGIKATVRVVEKVTPKPNYEMINSLIK